jgi:hypothetical protein
MSIQNNLIIFIGSVKQRITQICNMHNYLVGYYNQKIFNILYQHKIKVYFINHFK